MSNICRRDGLTVGPGLVDGSLLVELLSQMLQSLQTSDLAEDPLLVAFLCSFQSVPRSVDVLINEQQQELVNQSLV